MTHNLKTYPGSFRAVKQGRKKAEFRKDDRVFQEGDYMRLQEWVPTGLATVGQATGHYTGEELLVRVTHVQPGGTYGIPKGYAMLSFDPVEVSL